MASDRGSPSNTKHSKSHSDILVASIGAVGGIVAALVAGLIGHAAGATNNIFFPNSATPEPTVTVTATTTVSSSPAAPASTPSPASPGPSYIQASPTLSPGESVGATIFTVGMCFNFSQTSSNTYSTSYEPCSSPHNGQIIAMLNASGSPSGPAANGVLGTDCTEILNATTKPAGVQYYSYLSFPGDYDSGDRAFQCFAISKGANTSTSLVTW
jgi:hypothetical protein